MAGRPLVSAERMSYIVDHDVQFRFPERPRLIPGLVLVPLPDGLLVEGAAERQVFRGKAALTLLPRLLPLLDGTRSLTEIQARLPDLLPGTVKSAIALLLTRGVLEDMVETAGTEQKQATSQLQAYCERVIDVTRVNRNGHEALIRAQQARVALVGPTQASTVLATHLTAGGIGSVEVWGEKLPGEPVNVDLIVGLEMSDVDTTLLKELDRHCRIAGTPWVRFAQTGKFLELGPFIEPGNTLCYECLKAGQTELPPTDSRPGDSEVLLDLAAMQITYLISGLAKPVHINEYVRLDLTDWHQVRLRHARRPGCPNCGPLPDSEPGSADPAYAYEQSVALLAKHHISPKQHQAHYKAANLEMQRDEKRYPSAPVIRLPDGGFQGDGLTLDELAILLNRGAGLRKPLAETTPGEKVQRWAPTGGNLGSVQIYLLALEVNGLIPGLYFYQHGDHTLAALAPVRSTEDWRTLATQAAPHLHPGYGALLILTGAHVRLQSKYETFAYRVLHLDAGVAAAQIQAVAQTCQLRVSVATRWDDLLLETELGLNPEAEPITGVLAIYGWK